MTEYKKLLQQKSKLLNVQKDINSLLYTQQLLKYKIKRDLNKIHIPIIGHIGTIIGITKSNENAKYLTIHSITNDRIYSTKNYHTKNKLKIDKYIRNKFDCIHCPYSESNTNVINSLLFINDKNNFFKKLTKKLKWKCTKKLFYSKFQFVVMVITKYCKKMFQS